MKKFLSILICFMIISSNYVYGSSCVAFSESTEEVEIQLELQENINNQLNNLDTTKIDELFGDVIAGELFNSSSFSEKISLIINGDESVNATTFLGFVGQVFFDEIVSFIPLICIIIAIAILYSMLSNFTNKKGITDVVHFACFGAIVVIVVMGITNLITTLQFTMTSMKNQMDTVFPVLLTTLTALGGTNSVGIFQPAMGILSGTIISLFTKILLPIFLFKIIFNVISNLTKGIKFSNFSDFFGSTFKWLIGIVLTIFTAFVSIQGLMAGTIDGVSIKTAKYTIKGSVPLIGGFLSDGMGLVMASSSIIKNAVGVGGLLLLFSTIVVPVIKIIVFSFLLKLTSAILEPIADGRVTNFVSSMSKTISMSLALVLGVAFMYLIIVGLVMCSANYF